MEGFIAAIGLREKNTDFQNLTQTLEKTARDCFDNPAKYVTFGNKNLVFACAAGRKISDTSVRILPDGSLIYVNGCLTALTTGTSRQPWEDDIQGGIDSPDQKLADFRSAVRSSTLESSGTQFLSGSYHGLYYDAGLETTSVALDRLASRPVFYTIARDILFISSDIRGIWGLPFVNCSLDKESLVQFVRFQMILGDQTLY